ncbi:DUF5994 family protein [Kitasatospora sp. NBC_01250]|uniref:DUF5994 family protein n=1 Tax=unclassified Kitasatospora TaxID=2633591 RepID=UPI002E132AFA|nr:MULTISPECIES: DUF5994 family protein [unclassified Kitasatospora]WSJ68074.1 DUF5994 family protein [Kitasatospora sp. NBC_01302]
MTPIPLTTPSPSGPWPVADALLPRLELEPTMSREGVFDGAWWPRSNHVATELPDLITALGAHVGPVVRVGLDTSAWDGVPRSVMVDGLMIKINWFAGSAATISVTRGFQDHFLLLVVPPGTDPTAAAAAMAGASATGNHTPAAELLIG